MLLDDTRCGSPESRGWYRFLVENHYLFDMPQTTTVLEQDWFKYDAIIMPGTRYISDALAQRLDDYVKSGGVLIASGPAGFYNDDYAPRDLPAIQSLGIIEPEAMRDLDRSAYFLMDKSEFERFPETDLFYVRSRSWDNTYAEGAQQRFKLIPPHNFGPPERTYWDIVTERPAFVVNSYGQGQAIYIPWEPGQLFYRQGHTNTVDFVADLLQSVAGVEPVGGNLSPMVEATLFEHSATGELLIHLVNASGHFGTTYYAPVTMHDVKAVLPCEMVPSTVTSLVSGDAVPFCWQEGRLAISVETLDLFEAIVVG